MTKEITIKKVTRNDLSALLTISRKTFFDAFYNLNNPVDMAAYAAKFFTPGQTLLEFTNPDSAFYFAMIHNEIAGYIKLNYRTAQTEFKDSQALELERIYVSRYHQNKGIGNMLLDFAINEAITRSFNYIWLGVWEHNARAIKFYKRNGFGVIGQHNFMLGDDLQVDVLMKKML